MAPRKPDQHQRILQPVGHRPDGTPLYIADRVAEALRLGASLNDAATRATVTSATLRTWVRAGTRLLLATEAGTRLPQTLSAVERAQVDLARTVEQAAVEGKMLLLGQLERLSRGIERTITIEKQDAAGTVIERTTRVETALPDAATIRWRLARRWPDEFADRVHVDHTGQVDTGDRAAELAAALRAELNAQPNGNGHAANGATKR